MGPKIAVIGAGNVGATVAQYVALQGTGECVLVDIVEGLPQGKALDMSESLPALGLTGRVTGSNDMAAIRGADVVVITAGLPRKPGMSRDDLTAVNAGIVKGVAEKVREHAPSAHVVVVTNPLDVMTYLAWKVTGFPRARVSGMAGVLDSTRFAWFVACELKVSPRDVTAMVLGGHGDQMVPLPRWTTVSGVPLTELLGKERIEALVKRTRDGGAEIVALLKQGSAYYAPGASAALMVRAILADEKRLLPCAAILDGEYGFKDVAVGVPVILGRGGVERIVELELERREKDALVASAAAVSQGIAVLKAKGFV